MDVVALGLAKADAARKYSSPGHFAGLMSRLQAGNEDAVWAILGDSTGNETTEWVYLTAQWLAGQFPAVTVLYRLWNDTNQNYDAATTVQTGTGSRTLTIYNGSTSGQNAAYSVTRIALQIPVTPHAITVSYGHNEGSTNGAGYRPLLYALTRQLEDWFPTASLIVTAQNPRAATDANYSLDLSRAQATIELAATEGYGLVNATQAFLNTANYATTLLIGDGLHPNGAGSALWASLVQQRTTARQSPRFRLLSLRVRRVGRRGRFGVQARLSPSASARCSATAATASASWRSSRGLPCRSNIDARISRPVRRSHSAIRSRPAAMSCGDSTRLRWKRTGRRPRPSHGRLLGGRTSGCVRPRCSWVATMLLGRGPVNRQGCHGNDRARDHRGRGWRGLRRASYVRQ
jgi:lysophospholipase L1-like esterase